MKAPDKIYLQICGDCNDNDCENCKFEFLEDNVTWCKDKIFDKDIEYTRTDVFMEKACDYLQKNLWRIILEENEFRQRFVTDFKYYMKGE